MHQCGAAAFLQRFWCPSAHQHSFAHFYRFVDDRLEARYRCHTAAISRTILAVYCVLYFSFAIQNFVKFPVDCPLFWMMLSVSISSALLALGCIACWSRLHALPVHAVYVCVLSGVVTTYLRWSTTSGSEEFIQYVGGGTSPLAMDPGVQRRLEQVVHGLDGYIEILHALFFNLLHWGSLSFAGWNCWTSLAYTIVFAASATGLFLSAPADIEVHLFNLTLITFAFVFISVATERVRRSDFLAQVQLARELQASQLADGVLNHMLKNALADVAADIEVFLAGELGPDVLEDAVVCLRRGMRSCRERMVYLKMVAGEYVPVLNAIKVQDFGRELVAGRNVATHLPDCTLLMDSILMQLILENALSNAVKHGHPLRPDVRLAVQVEKHGAVDSPNPVVHRVTFTVTNIAHPSQPRLTEELVRPLLDGQRSAWSRPPPVASVVPTLSDGIGLRHCGLAARLGGIALSLTQEGDVVTFTATLEAEVLEDVSSCNVEDEVDQLALQCPAALTICCLDDSASSRRLLEYHLTRGFPTATVRICGLEEGDVHTFLREVPNDADIVVLDQNLQYAANTYYGTDVCQQLLAYGYRGLVCIRSSDDSPEDQARYAASGAHCSFGKDVLGTRLVQHLKAAYVSNVLRPNSDLQLWVRSPHCFPLCPSPPTAPVPDREVH